MGRFAVRAATFADAPALMELEAAARAERPQDLHMQTSALSCPVLVALDRDGAVAGFARTIDGPGGCLTLIELYVARSQRRRGCGSALVAAVVAAARAAGREGVSLGVNADNARARRLYGRHGFRAVGEAVMVLRLAR